MSRQLVAIHGSALTDTCTVHTEDHPLLGLRWHADRRCQAIDYPEPSLRMARKDAEGTPCDRCVDQSSIPPAFAATPGFVRRCCSAVDKFTAEDIDRWQLHDFATRYANNYAGRNEYMLSMRARASRRLSSGQARGVMNFWKAHHHGAYTSTG